MRERGGQYILKICRLARGWRLGRSTASRRRLRTRLVATSEGCLGERGLAWYFSYVRDLDANKLCAYCTRISV